MKAGRTRIFVVGGGGHAAVVIEALLTTERFEIIGFVDRDATSSEVLGFSRLGDDECIPALRSDGVDSAALGIGDNTLRETMAARLAAQGLLLPPIVHASALVSPSARLDAGVVVMAGAVVGTRTRVRRGAIVNSGAVVDHDGALGDASHVAPGAALSGCVTVGARTLVGVGSSVRPGIMIGEDAVIGAGSAVVADVANGACVGGVPARRLRRAVGDP